MTVYLDEVFAVNLIMDWLILWATGNFARYSTKRWRLVLAAALGALYSIIIFFPWGIWLACLPVKLCCAFVLVFVAYPFVNWQNYLKNVVYFYFISFVLGGASLAVPYLFGQAFVETWNGIALVQIDFQQFWLVVAVSLVMAATFFLRQQLRQDLSIRPCIVTAQISLAGAQISLPLLVDTGNSLSDPLTAQPVVVVEQDCLLPLFPEKFQQQLQEQHEISAAQLPFLAEQSGIPGRWRLIPYQVVGQQGLLLGFRPDGFIVQDGTKQTVCTNVVVAFIKQKFSPYATYQGLLPPTLRTERSVSGWDYQKK